MITQYCNSHVAAKMTRLRKPQALIKLKNQSGRLEEDHMMGQLVQHAVIRRPEVYRAMMDKLDTKISCGRPPTFAFCVLTLESCFQRPEVNDVTPSFNSMAIHQQPLSMPEDDEHYAIHTMFQITCHNCNKQGHMAKDCPEPKLTRPTTSAPPIGIRPMVAPANFQAHSPIITPPTTFPFHNSHQPFHHNQHPASRLTKQPDFYRSRYQERLIPAVKAKIVKIGLSDKPEHKIAVDDVTNPGDRQSVYDTGASHSLTAQQSFVTGVGSLIYLGYNGRKVIINGIFYSPDATGTLISPAALINSGAKMNHIGNNVLICGNCGEPLLQANYNKDGRKWLLPLFSTLLACAIDDVNFQPSQTATPCIEGISLIHAPNFFSAMSAKTHKDNQNAFLNADHQNLKTELMKWHCLFGHIGLRRIRKLLGKTAPMCFLKSKQEINDCEDCLWAKSLRQSSLSQNNRSVILLDLLVADLMGPFDVPTIHGGRYALNIWDVASTYGKCHILSNKSDAPTRLRETDNGGEFRKWLTNEGIHHERSLPFFHQKNGIVERYNRTVADMGRTILLGLGLPKTFWGHAFISLDRLRTFGETAFVHIPQEKRQRLSYQAVKARAVLHLPDGKGWVFYDEDNNKFLSSAWAKFPESEELTRHLSKLCATPKKGDINFVLNNLKLGDFKHENLIDAQNHLVEKLSHPTQIAMSLTPKTYKQAVNSSDSAEWRSAIENELLNMKKHNVFEVLPIPGCVKLIGRGWVFIKKPGIGTEPARFKEQYVASGNSQLSGVNLYETFAPTATFALLQILLTLAEKFNLITASFDFTAAYLNAYIDEEVWISPSDGLVIPSGSGCRLRKAFYDSSVYVNSKIGLTVWLHVDDGVVFGQRQDNIDNLKCSLCEEFDIKWNNGLKHIIGIEIDQTETGFHLSQPSLIQSIINKYWDKRHMPQTPLPPKYAMVSLTNDSEIMHQAEFIAAVGALSYVATGTWPDIAFAVNLLARHSKYPGKDHWYCLQYLLGYLSGSITRRLSLIPDVDASGLEVYSDASWGGEFSRSTHGYLV
ncbi:hypothetical protein O181_019239 [Austropuccinia psidii MF-1]|uniref:CCHC-type domain-containing protein n=1 Tax=Austropuccinia psidii MF-1 TaxID=1389203 RepID=A0A9Q3C950_9BASI|nr:hypothetical protein [Austropuccinia psidii MF-1]